MGRLQIHDGRQFAPSAALGGSALTASKIIQALSRTKLPDRGEPN
jgi:hypothetical protein